MFLRSTVVMKVRIVFNYYEAILIVRSLFKIFLFCLMSHYSFFKCDSYNILLESAYFSGCCNLSHHTILLFYIQYEYFLPYMIAIILTFIPIFLFLQGSNLCRHMPRNYWAYRDTRLIFWRRSGDNTIE